MCFFGAPLETGNLGCRALTSSLVTLIKRTFPPAKISLVYGEQRSTRQKVRISAAESCEVEVVNYRLSPRARLREHLLWVFVLALVCRLSPSKRLRVGIIRGNPILSRIAESDLVADVRGGDSFSDIYGRSRLLIGSLTPLISILLGKKVVFLPQTYGPYRSAFSRWIARILLRRSLYVLSRDRTSLSVVRGLRGVWDWQDDPGAQFCPDVAFALEPIAPPKTTVQPPLEWTDGSILVGVNVSGLLYVGGYNHRNMFGLRDDYATTLRALVARLLALPKAHVLLIPHSFGEGEASDATACRKVWESMCKGAAGRLHLAEGPHDQNEIKSVIGQCDFLIGSRMHACIAALSQGIPAAAIAYSRKFLGVFECLGMEELVLDARELSSDQIVASCLDLLGQREALKAQLATGVPKVRALLDERFRTCLASAVGAVAKGPEAERTA
ncbi:MAG: polysaccharide pyruvyl transferase family protein [Candidatus Sumerlaeota bacterium]|nr:polysaccharide pyruvyl transferase family protein [Candidatus Sumerlaeota bacterium]